MSEPPRTGRAVGALLFLHLATGLMIPYILLMPLQGGLPETAAGMAGTVRLGVLLLVVGGALPVLISLALQPLVGERDRRLWFGLLALAAVNLAMQLVENAQWLTTLSLSQAHAAATAAQGASFEAMAVVVKAGTKWVHYAHLLVVVGWLSALYALFLRQALVPRALASLGLAACALHFIGITLPVFAGYRMPAPELFGMPLGLVDLAVAAWLMAKGFRQSGQHGA